MAGARIAKRQTKSGPRWDVKWRTAGRGGQDLMRTFKTKADAEHFKATLVIEGGVLPRSDKMTLREAFTRYMAVKKTSGRSKGTLDQYDWSYRHLRINEDLPLDAFTTEFINRLIEKLKKGGATNGVLVKVQQLLSGIFDLAIAEGRYLGDNPAKKSLKVKRRAPSKGPVMLPLKTVQELAAAIPEHQRAAFWMMAGLGLRRGEVEALKRSDFAGDLSTVHIQRTKTNKYEGPTKTPKSNRVLTIPKFVRDELEKVKPHGTANRMFYVNQKWGEDVLEPACEAIGIQRLTPHDLRDVAAGTLLHNGMDLASVSRQLGHASVHITAQRYLASLDDSSERAAALMDEVHGGPKPKKAKKPKK